MSFKNRVIAAFLALLIMAAPIFSGVATAAKDVRYIRVLLSSYGTVSRATLKINGSYYLKEYPDIPLTRGTSVTISVSSGKLNLNAGAVSIPLGTSVTFIRAASSSSSNWLTMTSPSGYNYPGDMTFSVSGSSLRMVAKVYIEDYLQGVIPHEMSNSWPMEALKAQAVASRTYAIASMNASRDYDVVDTSSSQVYRGYNPANNNTLSAIRESSGQVLYWNNSISDGVFSASNGGQTRARKPYWGSSNTYHTVKDDPYDLANPSSPLYRFIFPITCGDTYSLDSRLESVILPAVCDAAEDSNIDCSESDITIQGFNNISLHTLPEPTSKGSYDPNSYEFQKATVETRVEINGEEYVLDATIKTSDLKAAYKGATSTLASHRVYYVEEPTNKKCLYIVARGYGHGIGLSQRGAQTMANQGFTYTDILDFYYTGTNLVTAVEPADSLPAIPRGSDLYGTVVTSGAAMRKSASYSSDYVSGGTLADGSTVRILMVIGNWYLVLNTDSDVMGYVTNTEVVESNGVQPTPDPNASPVPTVTGTVTATNLMVRSGPGVQNSALGSIPSGTVVTILTKGTDWHCIRYKSSIGYVSARYVHLNGDSDSDIPVVNPDTTPVPVVTRGEVTATTLNLRIGPGTYYDSIGIVTRGTILTVLEKGTWYTIDYNGRTVYVSGTYIRDIVSDAETEEPDSPDSPVPTATPQPDASPAPTPSPTATPEALVKKTGTVNASSLKVRSGAGTRYDEIGRLTRGEEVEILEAGTSWHRITYKDGIGYVGANYIVIHDVNSDPSSPDIPQSGGPLPSPKAVGTVNAGSLTVRSGPGTQNAAIGTLRRGETVEIVEQGSRWHSILYCGALAYVSADYILLDDGNADPPATDTRLGIVTASSLKIRSGPGASCDVLGILSRNAVVTITQLGDDWHTITHNGTMAYVSADYIDVQYID